MTDEHLTRLRAMIAVATVATQHNHQLYSFSQKDYEAMKAALDDVLALRELRRGIASGCVGEGD